MVVNKIAGGIDFRVTLRHVTTEASLAKIDSDAGLQEDEGPGRNKFVTVAARRYFKLGLFVQPRYRKQMRGICQAAFRLRRRHGRSSIFLQAPIACRSGFKHELNSSK